MTSPLIDENALLRRIEAIERAQRELGPSIAASFQTTVAELQAQNMLILAQQAEILELVDAVVVPVGDRTTASTGTVDGWTGGMSTRLSFNLPKPSGYTEAIVVGTGAMGVLGVEPTAATARITIEGNSGYSTILPVLRSSGGGFDFSSGTVTHTRSITGLSSDVTVSLDVDMSGVTHASDPTMNPYQGAQLTAIALFMK